MSKHWFSPVIIAAIVAPALSSVAWVTEQEAVQRLPILVVGSFSPLIAGLILLIFSRLRRGRVSGLRLRDSWRELLTISILRNGIGFFLFLFALTLTSSIKIMFLTKMEPYLVLLIQWLRFREEISRQQTMLLLIHVVGAIILSTGGELSFQFDQLGDLCVILGLLANALVYEPAQRLGARIGSTQASAWSQLLPGLVLAPAALLFYPEGFTSNSPAILAGWGYLLITVVLFYVLSTSLWFYSLQGLPGWLCSALRSVGPVIAAPIAWFLFEKSLTTAQLWGAGIVLATSFLMIRDAGSGRSRGVNQKT